MGLDMTDNDIQALESAGMVFNDDNVSVRFADVIKCRASYANRGFEEGQLVFSERKLFGIRLQEQSEEHAAIEKQTCAFCMRITAVSVDERTTTLHKTFSCPNKCGLVFCSEECVSTYFNSHHKLLCPNSTYGNNEAKDLFLHQSTVTNESFQILGQIVASIIINAEASPSTPVETFMRRFLMYTQGLWCDVIIPPEDEDESEFMASMEEILMDSLDLLKEALNPFSSTKKYASLFQFDFYASLMGALELNSSGTVSRVEIPALDLGLDEDEESYVVIVCEGIGIYSRIALLNHSCEPNVALLKPEDCSDDTTAVIAIRPIVKGEELCISYIDETAPLEERRVLLEDYQFDCECPKCVMETSLLV